MTGTITVAEAVGRALAARGVAHVFAVVGSGNFEVTHALVDAGAGYTQARHEMGAASMADAYTRLTGRVAAVSLHQGCGLTNAMTGIGEAAKAHTPVLVVTGDSATGDEIGNFAIDQDALVASVGAVPRRITSAESAVAEAVAAFDHAVRHRATVVLSLPIDIQDRPCSVVDASPPQELLPAGASADATARVVEILDAAARPVIVGGRGARHAATELRALAERTGALLVASGGARGLFTHDEWGLDIMGGFSTDGAAELIAGADVLVAFGASLNRWTAREGALTGQPIIVQIDDDPAAFGRHRPVTLGVRGDTARVAADVVAAWDAAGHGTRTGYRTAETAARRKAVRRWVDQDVTEPQVAGCIGPAALTRALNDILPAERVVVPDGGNVNLYPGAFLEVPDEQGFVLPLAFQAIGLGLASCVGAAIARPDRVAVLGTGDGAFMMGAVELDTAVREKLGMVVVVYNDSAYGAEVHIFADQPDKHDIVRFPDTDIAAVARGYGCEAITVREVADLAPLQGWLAGPRDRPFVIDAKIAGFPSPMMARSALH